MDRLLQIHQSEHAEHRPLSFSISLGGYRATVFLFFSNNLGCAGSLLVSAVVTLILLLLFGVIELG